jgi:hypothetical protein
VVTDESRVTASITLNTEQVLAAIDTFLVGLRTKDTVMMGRLVDSTTRFTLLRPAQTGGVRVIVLEGRQFMAAVTAPISQAFEEPIRNPVVHVDGDLASVWAEYQVHVGARRLAVVPRRHTLRSRSHTGVR